MYRYDEHDRRLLQERISQFRGQVNRYLAGELSEDEFRQLRLRNGLYVELHAPMLRVAIPYGLLSSEQLRMLAHVSRTYDKGYGHFTTRQNIQFNWPELERVPDLLADLARVDMHAIQTSGNVVRNVTADHLAGVAPDEIEDPRPYCEILRQWSTLHPEFNWLPRKFKIAVSGAEEDRAATGIHDIGLRIVRSEAGEIGFRVLVGGGLGRTPMVARELRTFLPRRHLLSYVEAILRVYNLHGRRDNIHKARIKILVNSLGLDRFREMVESTWAGIKDGPLTLEDEDIRGVQAHFRAPVYRHAAGWDESFDARREGNPLFAQWVERNTLDHRVNGYRAVLLPLKAHGAAPGDLTAEQMEAVATLADRFSFGRVRVTHTQNLLLADVAQADLYPVWIALARLNLAVPNAGTLADLICCPGLDYCSLANAGSIGVARDIHERFDSLDYLYDLGEIELKMSGCVNACGHHHVGHIGILGVEKHGQEWYQITLGGSAGNDTALGDRLGPAVSREEVAGVVERILTLYLEERLDGERFLDTYRRLGIEPFKERTYEHHSRTTHRARRLAACA